MYYIRSTILYARRDLNPQPSDPKSDALSNWATGAILAGEQGFEPQFYGPEPYVLPLDDSPKALTNVEFINNTQKSQIIFKIIKRTV